MSLPTTNFGGTNARPVAVMLVLTGLLTVGCAAQPAAQKGSLELQAYQAKEFESTKRITFSATMSVFQDLGFIVDDGDFDTGLITATGPTVREDGGMSSFWAVLLTGQDVRTTIQRRATAFVEEMPSGRIRIRLNFVDNARVGSGIGAVSSRPVEQAEFYQGTFEKIDKAIFIRSSITP